MIEVSGNIRAELDGHQMVISGQGDEINLEVDRLDQVVKSLSASRVQRKRAATRLAQELQQRGLTFRVSSGGKPVAVLGRGARTGPLCRLLRMPHLELARNWKTYKLLFG